MLPIRTILVATDFSIHADAAVRLAAGLASDYRARLIVLHVDPPVVSHGEEIDRRLPEYRQRLQEALDRVAPPVSPGIEVERILDEGPPAKRIVQTARERDCDLIVMGTHGRGMLARMVLGSVAEHVVREAPCAVLTVRENPAV